MFRWTPTSILIVFNILVFAYTSVVGGSFPSTNPIMLERFGQYNRYVIRHGWYWQLLTSMFIHVDFLHLFLNMLFLLIFGLRAEELFSVDEFFLIYFLSGLFGNLLTLLMPLNTVSAGASGAIFGMFGACVIYIRKMVGGSAIGALIFSFYFLLLNSASPQINLFAHFGGLVAGLVIGYVLAKSRKIVL
ncbi:rhomboid family intramembrane serine protease [Candidatus Bathyarchaeota archaeon]|nr:rhomboid family intramembrane serine protease [Candidatus Bathyarchaeota archaeon]NIU80771.1 rhomboid family intramembrane serine protease [Candidatus Bathyarchaeota archaeon]NIV67396.1 rhomboid family intramembrane serine protease [Candidatus Bathyarchaeota archaeon]NIW15940.1 rhomboid family intramembrane serine protease [Candidatus Bathyarchaeota archaeon]NIW34042.1 rhomboid family intramembrane serine protease [Candidatus Bathyarchaeota archaeon]